MSYRSVLAACSLTALTFTAAPAPAAALTLTAWEREGSEVFDLYVRTFVDLAAELSGGELQITPFGAGVIAGVFDGHAAVTDGIADMAFGWAGYIVNQHAGNAFFGALPGGMGPEALYHWTYSGGGKELLTEFRRAANGQHAVACGLLGSEVFAHSHRRIQTLADLEGLRHRTAGAFVDVIRALGATPTVIPGPDVFAALERRAIDSAEYLTPYLNSKVGFQNVAEYVIMPGIHTPAAVYEVTMNIETWEGLSERSQRAIELACEIVSSRSYTFLGDADMKSTQELAAGRNQIVVLDDEVIERIRDEGRNWINARAAATTGDDWIERIGEAYFTYQDQWLSSFNRVQ
ncbi:MAG: hypothetical protein EA356_15795 [Geminicoccaceae bacterium]|nr:MAG: hypothetical protein EA356_15795 [Geminicoccaceae bacterium]